MLFKRRTQPGILQRLRTWVWPRRSWSRSLRYFLLRLKRVRATPHQVALGCAAGVFASITPLLGTQMVLAALLAYVIRANIPAALIGTFFGNPVSWPLIWAGTYVSGCYLLGIENGIALDSLQYYVNGLAAAVATWSPDVIDSAVTFVWPVVKPMLAGSLLIGIAVGVVIYYTLRPVIAAYQRQSSTHLSATATI